MLHKQERIPKVLRCQIKYLRRFISNLVGKTKEFSNFVKLKDMEEFRWEERHQETFGKIKEFLPKPPVFNASYTRSFAQIIFINQK